MNQQERQAILEKEFLDLFAATEVHIRLEVVIYGNHTTGLCSLGKRCPEDFILRLEARIPKRRRQRH